MNLNIKATSIHLESITIPIANIDEINKKAIATNEKTYKIMTREEVCFIDSEYVYYYYAKTGTENDDLVFVEENWLLEKLNQNKI